MNELRSGHAAVLLGNGDVLVSGGRDSDSEALPSTETFRPGPSPLTTITPTSLDFGLQEVGTTGPAKAITIVNHGEATLSIASVTVVGRHASDFAASLRCSGSVPPGDSCDIEVRFSPTAPRGRAASVLIVDNAPDSPHAIPLSGFGFSEVPNQWSPAGTMSLPRQLHTATRLPDGDVLVAGGDFSRTGTVRSCDWCLVSNRIADRQPPRAHGHAAAERESARGRRRRGERRTVHAVHRHMARDAADDEVPQPACRHAAGERTGSRDRRLWWAGVRPRRD